MAVRRHVIAARNTTREAFAAALAALNVSEVEEANGWCWAMASVWTTGALDLVSALAEFDGPYFLTTTEDGCRWRLHLRAKGLEPFDTVHEFQWIGHDPSASDAQPDWADLEDEDEVPEVVAVELPGFPPMPAHRLEPLDFEDDYFLPYADDGEEEEDEEGGGEYRELTPLEYISSWYDENGIPLPSQMIDALAGLPDGEIYPRFLALHGALIADALARFSVPHDRAEVIRILTGENLLAAERESDVGNLWRFLHHLGLGPKFAEAIEEFERVEGPPPPPEDPALRIIKATARGSMHDVNGGPASIPLKDVFLMARLTYYQDAHPEYAACVRFDGPADWPAGATPSYAVCAPLKKGFGVNISLEGMDVPTLPKARQRLGELFVSLPDGARLELLGKGQFSKTRLAGRVNGGNWLLEQASGPLAAEDVCWMLDLFRAAESRGPQATRDEAEVEAVLDSASRNLVLCNDPPRRDGLNLHPGERREAESLGGLIFRHRLADRWDFKKFETHNARRYKDWRDFEAEMARENALPATETVTYAGETSRFFEADYKAKSIDKAMRAKAKSCREIDRAMAELGYTLLGAVVCEKVGGGILRCYANAAEKTYSANYLLPYGQQWHDFTTRFEDGTSLTTGNGLMEGSIRSLRMLQRRSTGMGLTEMRGKHREGIERLAGHGLTPAEIDATLEGVCRAMDEFLTRRLGNQ